MKLHRLALSEFKRFRTTMVLDHLDPGLNIVVGANEAGKSTLAVALRAAFLERFKTSTLSGFVPEGMAQARPTVEVDFEVGTSQYRLTKTFVNRARCELTIDSRRLEGEQAELALAALLGFEVPAKGQSKPLHAGVPGLLWITQGSTPALAEPAQHAGAHLRDALTRLSGELAATDGDRLFLRIDTERSALLDARHGRAKGAYRQAQESLEQAQAALSEVQARVAAWESDVDRLAELRLTHTRDSETVPWLALEQQANAARARLAALSHEREALQASQTRLTQSQATAALLADHVARDAVDVAAIADLAAKCAVANQSHQDAQARVQSAARIFADAKLTADGSAANLTRVRLQHDRHMHAQQVAKAKDTHVALQVRLLDIDKQTAELARLRELASQTAFSQDDLKRLRAGMNAEVEWGTRARAVAPRLSYEIATGKSILISGQAVSGAGELPILAASSIVLEGIGRLTITPGGDDLARAAAKSSEVSAANRALCLRLGVSGLEQAEARALASTRAQQEAEYAERALALIAPEGGEAVHRAARQAADAWRALEGYSTDAADGGIADDTFAHAAVTVDTSEADTAAMQVLDAAALIRLQAEHERVLAQATRTRDAWRDATAAVATAQAQSQWLADQYTAYQANEQDGQGARARAQRQQALDQARADVAATTEHVRQADAALRAQQPELIEQDAQRLARSAQVSRDTHQNRLAQIQQLQGKLEQAGAQGLGDVLASHQADCERWQRRCDEFALRANALTLLHERVRVQREAATQRLFEPLARRLSHYLNVLFPQARLSLSEDFTPSALLRGDAHDELASLSFGTQEQLGVLTRLAYADVLREAGRPTLLVLDDALVHTDDARRGTMKRALFDAATRHQILLLTCHGESWRDMGVPLRTL